jgi:GT2 family glycosyltransferase
LGAHYATNDILAFSDVDVFLGMNYLYDLSAKVSKGGSFVATRSQESMAHNSRRIVDYINYGNTLVHIQDFRDVNGFDESICFYGGDDDDLYHRLKLKGVREINPYDHLSACHFSILHGDELRLGEFKDNERQDPEKRFEEIYGNKDFKKSECTFFKNGAECALTKLYSA